MQPVRIALIGAGSNSFGPATVRDVLLSPVLQERGAQLVLMDINDEHVRRTHRYADAVARQAGVKNIAISSTTCLEEAVDGASFAVTAIEINRFLYWTQDFHVPREFGFKQPFGENGGPGGTFHALRNIPPTLKIAREMEKRCPDVWLLNYTNPEHWLVEAVSRLTKIKTLGLCHGVFMGMEQIARLLERKIDELEYVACGMNHLTFFQVIRDKKTGEDLYPLLRELDAKIDLMYDWHDLGLSRIVFRRFGLWPSPASNHIAEYIGWSDDYVASNLQFHYDPAAGQPWQGGAIPEFVYHIGHVDPHRPMFKKPADLKDIPVAKELKCSGEVAIPFIEAMACGQKRKLDAINLPNRGVMPGLDDDTVVEVPAVADNGKLNIAPLERLPEGILALLRTQGSIRKLGVEAFAAQSKDKLLQAILLEPTCPSYRQAIAMVDRMLELQKDILPPMR